MYKHIDVHVREHILPKYMYIIELYTAKKSMFNLKIILSLHLSNRSITFIDHYLGKKLVY